MATRKKSSVKREDGRVLLTYDEAVARLADGEEVHCFMNPFSDVLLGSDWAREDVLKTLRDAAEIHETGPAAQAMGHGIAVHLPETKDWAFFATRESL